MLSEKMIIVSIHFLSGHGKDGLSGESGGRGSIGLRDMIGGTGRTGLRKVFGGTGGTGLQIPNLRISGGGALI